MHSVILLFHLEMGENLKMSSPLYTGLCLAFSWTVGGALRGEGKYIRKTVFWNKRGFTFIHPTNVHIQLEPGSVTGLAVNSV